jgi:hypothetical protein
MDTENKKSGHYWHHVTKDPILAHGVVGDSRTNEEGMTWMVTSSYCNGGKTKCFAWHTRVASGNASTLSAAKSEAIQALCSELSRRYTEWLRQMAIRRMLEDLLRR